MYPDSLQAKLSLTFALLSLRVITYFAQDCTDFFKFMFSLLVNVCRFMVTCSLFPCTLMDMQDGCKDRGMGNGMKYWKEETENGKQDSRDNFGGRCLRNNEENVRNITLSIHPSMWERERETDLFTLNGTLFFVRLKNADSDYIVVLVDKLLISFCPSVLEVRMRTVLRVAVFGSSHSPCGHSTSSHERASLRAEISGSKNLKGQRSNFHAIKKAHFKW